VLPARARKILAVAAAVLAAYGAGVLSMVAAGGGGSSSASKSVIDEAEERIAADSAHPLSQQQLERAAVQGMLYALGDQWSVYYAPAEFTRFEQVLAG